MSQDKLMHEIKTLFQFHPDAEFSNLDELLHQGFKSVSHYSDRRAYSERVLSHLMHSGELAKIGVNKKS